MEGRGRALWLVLLAAAIAVVSFNVDAATADAGQPAATAGAGPDTNVLCVSKCGTCPTVCSLAPPPPPSSSEGESSTTPPTPTKGGGSSLSPQGQNKGGHPSNYYYFFTAGGGRAAGCAGASVYALVFLVFLSLVANLQ